jgi:pantoate--beta-alanine ligase
MRVVREPDRMSSISIRLKKRGKSIGFVPTMGYLHAGHVSLIKKAAAENDAVVLSIFVNPTQFSPREDYKRYPRDFKRDSALARKSGCDIIFYPDAKAIYPGGYSTYVKVKGLSDIMCGISRPAHFEGVATICAKLFNIVRPDIAYFGQKDYQQAVIIKRMVKDLDMGFKVKMLPIVRERNGLAMSSRNRYLTPKQRESAAVLYQALRKARQFIKSGQKDASGIKKSTQQLILKRGFKIDYITIADPETLIQKERVDSSVVIALAARLGKVRLIDNIVIN